MSASVGFRNNLLSYSEKFKKKYLVKRNIDVIILFFYW